MSRSVLGLVRGEVLICMLKIPHNSHRGLMGRWSDDDDEDGDDDTRVLQKKP